VTNVIMFDAIDLSQIPAGPAAVGAYVDGEWPTASAAAARFPHAKLLTIATSPEHDAEALDVETGDAVPSEAPGWVRRQQARGIARPCLYASVSVMQAQLIPVLQKAGIPRGDVRLWSAHYAGTHICGPSTCSELSIDADGTQHTDRAFGRDLDQSLLVADFFAVAVKPAPPAAPSAPPWQETLLNSLPVLSEGAADESGHVFFVHRAQALVKVYGQITGLPEAAALEVSGTYDAAAKAAVQQVQEHARITVDGIVGADTWAVLVTGAP
jgi:hypothetical protein